MRRRELLRAAVVGAVVTLLAVIAFPGVGIGALLSSHGGAPSDVFASTETGACSGEDLVHSEPASLLPTSVHVPALSHIVAYFTATWSGPGKETELIQTLQVGGAEFFESSPDFVSGGGSQGFTIHTTDTVMWTFANVPAGDYVVDATARVAATQGAVYSGDGANLQSCALTVIVTPVAA